MKKAIFICLMLGTFYNLGFSQFANKHLAGKIEEIKETIVFIRAYDDTSTKYFSGGTGVKFYPYDYPFVTIVTCEHVISIKNTNGNGRTVKLYDKIEGYIPTNDKTLVSYPLTCIYTDEENDFAILLAKTPMGYDELIKKTQRKFIPTSQIKYAKDLKEGTPVVYVGYPGLYYNSSTLIYENEKHSYYYPLARLGMISQIIQEDNRILIDGFAQPGYSGSPVFSIEDTISFDDGMFFYGAKFNLIGLTKAYPNEFGNIYKNIKYEKSDSLTTFQNPGFTILTPINLINEAFESGKIKIPKIK